MTPDQVLDALQGSLAPATLVLGPGSWDVVCQAAGPDWLLHRSLGADDAREVRESALLFPQVGYLRVIALCIDGASTQVQNMLLKVLEEPPRTTRFILAAEGLPLPTVASRCRPLVLDSGEEDKAEFDPRDVASVAQAVRAAQAGQTAILAQACRGWAPVHLAVLKAWAGEIAASRMKKFDYDFAPRVTPAQALQLLAELEVRSPAKLAPLVALERVFIS